MIAVYLPPLIVVETGSMFRGSWPVAAPLGLSLTRSCRPNHPLTYTKTLIHYSHHSTSLSPERPGLALLSLLGAR